MHTIVIEQFCTITNSLCMYVCMYVCMSRHLLERQSMSAVLVKEDIF